MKKVINMIKDNPIVIKNLNWSFGDKKILDNINLQLNKGDFCSIIGPNGSGKTTLLKNISKNLHPNKNTVFIESKDLLSYSNKKLAQKIANVPQNTYIDFEFSALDIVLMGRTPYLGRFQKESLADLEIAQTAMENTNTWHLKDKKITQLSGGERQRVLTARAISQETEILLLDEPISHLDIHQQIEILDTVKNLNNTRNLTVVTVLHDLNIAAEYSDSVIMVNEGKILAYGNPKEVLTEENIKKVYDMKFHMMKNPITGKPYIIPLSKL